MRTIYINLFRFVLLIFLQIFVLNHIQFSGYINPYLYVLFILWLPFEAPGWLVLLLAFILGMTIDMAAHTIGYHTVATVFMSYVRHHLLSLISPRDGYEIGMSPTVKSLGMSWFLKYSIPLVLAHHLVLFWIESPSWDDFLISTLRALISSMFTLVLVIICQFLTVRRR